MLTGDDDLLVEFLCRSTEEKTQYLQSSFKTRFWDGMLLCSRTL